MRGRLLIFGALLAMRAEAATSYAGAAACRPCHAAIFAQQSASQHAKALAKSTGSQPPEWAFGAGAQAITFVRRIDPETYVEEGLTWFRAAGKFDITPGHPDSGPVRFRTLDPAAGILRCFSCHSTGAVTLAADESIVPAE